MRKLKVYKQPERGLRLYFQSVAVAVSEHITDKLSKDVTKTKNGKELVHYGTDIGIIMDEQKIRKLSAYSMDTLIGNLKRDVPNLSNYPDSDLIDTMKSRYIQSNGDIKEYERLLKNQIDSVIKDLEHKKKIEEFEKHFDLEQKSGEK